MHGLHSRGALPHLKRHGASYFVTFRLAGTLPQGVQLRLKREREAIINNATAAKRPLTWHEQTTLFDWYAEQVDKYLDAGQRRLLVASGGRAKRKMVAELQSVRDHLDDSGLDLGAVQSTEAAG